MSATTKSGHTSPSSTSRCPTCHSARKDVRQILPHPTEDAHCFDDWHASPLGVDAQTKQTPAEWMKIADSLTELTEPVVIMRSHDPEAFYALPDCEACGGTGKSRDTGEGQNDPQIGGTIGLDGDTRRACNDPDCDNDYPCSLHLEPDTGEELNANVDVGDTDAAKGKIALRQTGGAVLEGRDQCSPNGLDTGNRLGSSGAGQVKGEGQMVVKNRSVEGGKEFWDHVEDVAKNGQPLDPAGYPPYGDGSNDGPPFDPAGYPPYESGAGQVSTAASCESCEDWKQNYLASNSSRREARRQVELLEARVGELEKQLAQAQSEATVGKAAARLLVASDEARAKAEAQVRSLESWRERAEKAEQERDRLRDAWVELAKHIQWMMSHAKLRMEQTKGDKELNAFAQGGWDRVESLMVFIDKEIMVKFPAEQRRSLDLGKDGTE